MRKNQRKNYTFFVFMAVALLLCVATTMIAISDIKKTNHLEHSKSLNTIMSKMSEHLNISFNREWDRARGLTRRIEGMEFDSVEALTEGLCEIYTEEGSDFKVVDDKGIAYYYDGTREYWKDHRSILPDREIFLLSSIQFGGTKEKYMKYIVPLEEPIVIGDITVIYSVLNESLDSLRQDFNTTTFGSDCLSFVINENGAFIYENGSNDNMANSYNLISYVEKNVVFRYDSSFERFKNNLRSGVSDTALVTYANRNYYMSYSSLNLGNWSAVMFVPEVNLQSDDTPLTRQLLLDISIVFVTAALVFVFGFLHMWRKTVVRQRRAAEAERRSNEAKTNFLSSMSHDIRTPMNAVVGMTEIALRCKEPMPRVVREYLEKIQSSSNHLLTLINDILDISKIEAGKMPINVTEFSIINAIHELVNMIYPLAKQKNIDLQVHTHNIDREYIMGDDLRINQVYINLITNAVKYTPEGGRVDIDFAEEPIEEEPNKLRLICVVKDNGIGMSEHFQQVMYEPFARATDSRVNTVAGSGLGLAICYQIVELMNGSLDCESAPGNGTIFTATVIVEKGRPDGVYALKPMRILVVDNDLSESKDQMDVFEKLGVRADVVDSIVTLPEGDTPYQMAFVKLGSPANRGLYAVRQLRNRFGRDFPIVMTDIGDMTDAARRIAEAGVSLTMSKPYFARRVYHAIQAALGADAQMYADQSESKNRLLLGMNVLVAEDNDLNWEMLRELLKLYGITSVRAGNGKECLGLLRFAKEREYSAVLMDVRMPIMDGREATRIIRKSKEKWIRNLPVIAMTADAFADDIRECLECGMNAHLAKPINLDKLLTLLYDLAEKGSL